MIKRRYDDNLRSPVGLCPLGVYEYSSKFLEDAVKFAKSSARRLGFPIIEIELIDENFYTAYEDAVVEFSSVVTRYEIRNNMLMLKNEPLFKNFTGVPLIENGRMLIEASRVFSDYSGTGGKSEWHTLTFDTIPNVRVYDLSKMIREQNPNIPDYAKIEVKRVINERYPALKKSFNMGYFFTLNSAFNYLGNAPTVSPSSFMMLPLFDIGLRSSTIKMLDEYISIFSYEIINNKLRIFPKPLSKRKIMVNYSVNAGIEVPEENKKQFASNFGDVNFKLIDYDKLNDPAISWIRQYAYASVKEMLGQIRSKYQSLPFPGENLTLNGQELLAQAQQEKEKLIEQLKEDLTEASDAKNIELSSHKSENLRNYLKNYPLGIYVR